MNVGKFLSSKREFGWFVILHIPKMSSVMMMAISGHCKCPINLFTKVKIFFTSSAVTFNYRRSYHKKIPSNSTSSIMKFTNNYSSQTNDKGLPALTKFPVAYWPNFFKYAKNVIIRNLIINQFYDKNFSIEEFIVGSKVAVEVVSSYIARNDLKNLHNLVTEDVIEEVRNSLLKFSLKQILEIKVDPGDIYLSFPYDVNLVTLEDEENRRRFVEITMCYHILSGYKEIMQEEEYSVQPRDFEQNFFVLNYRFCRDFSEGANDNNWIINALNHSKPLVSDVYS